MSELKSRYCTSDSSNEYCVLIYIHGFEFLNVFDIGWITDLHYRIWIFNLWWCTPACRFTEHIHQRIRLPELTGLWIINWRLNVDPIDLWIINLLYLWIYGLFIEYPLVFHKFSYTINTSSQEQPQQPPAPAPEAVEAPGALVNWYLILWAYYVVSGDRNFMKVQLTIF